MNLSDEIQNRNFKFGVWNGIIFQLTFPFLDISLMLPLFLSKLTESVIVIGLAGAIALAGPALMQSVAASMLPRISSRMSLYIRVGYIRIAAVLGLTACVFGIYPATQSHRLLLVGSLACIALLQLSTGFSSLAFLDIVRTSMPVSRRGHLWGYRKFIGGIGIILVTPLIEHVLARYPYPYNYGILFAVVLMLTCAGIYNFSFVKEDAHHPDPHARKFPLFVRETLTQMRKEPGYYHLFTAQILINIWMMALPFYVIYIQKFMLITPTQIALLLAFQMTGRIISNIIWANLDDRYCSQLIYRWVTLPALAAPLLLLFVPQETSQIMIWLAPVFFLIGSALTGFEIGFTNITLDLADKHAYAGGVGVMNSLNGLLSLMPMAGGFFILWFGHNWLFILSCVSALFILPVSLLIKENVPPAGVISPGKHTEHSNDF